MASNWYWPGAVAHYRGAIAPGATSPYEGGYWDPITKTWATVTRATAATIYDPGDQRIHDVGANKIPMLPWGAYQAGGVGFAPVIEEARTNYLVNSYGAANTAGVWDSWAVGGGSRTGTPTYSLAQGVYGATAQRVRYTGVVGDASGNKTLYVCICPDLADGAFVEGEASAGSAYLKVALSGCTGTLEVHAVNAAGSSIGAVTIALSETTSFVRLSRVYSALPALTVRTQLRVFISNIGTGDTVDITIDAAQLEKGAFATSYISTTTAAATRDACQVTDPITGQPVATGTILAVCAPISSTLGPLAYITHDTGSAKLEVATITPTGTVVSNGSATAANVTAGAGVVLGMAWAANSLTAFKNGAAGTEDTTVTAPSGNATASYLGNDGTAYANCAVNQIVKFTSKKSAAEVLALNPLLYGVPGSRIPTLMGAGVL